ncbi:MAG: hypothetical protein PVG39_27080 [Desulfobacteraceae bacterium]|jgi:hypothetical protein
MEVVFIPQKVAYRLKEYAQKKEIQPYNRIFPISYQAAGMVVKKTGDLVGAHPERGNFWMEFSAFSYQPSAKSLF